MRLCYSIISCVLFLFVGCKDTSSTINPDDTTLNDSTFTDIRDEKKYGLVKINTQVWMSENLNASTYRNGDIIRHASTKQEWLDAAGRGEGAWCYYDHDPKNGAIYGKLYNWYAVKDSRGLAPKGYHIPNDAEWTILTDFLGGESVAGKKIKSTSGWDNGDNGDNSSGFNGLPGGECSNNGYFDGYFDGITHNGCWWSSSENKTNDAWGRDLNAYNEQVNRSASYKGYGLSVRCIKD